MPSDLPDLEHQAAPTDSSSSQTETPADVQSPAERPPQRMLIGSERDRGVPIETKAKPVTPASPPAAPAAPKKQPPKHYPPPNIRDQLSPDLEAEYQEALADL